MIIKDLHESIMLKDLSFGMFRLVKDPGVVRAIVFGIAELNKLNEGHDKILTVVIADNDEFNSQSTYKEAGQLEWLDSWERIHEIGWDGHPSFKVV